MRFGVVIFLISNWYKMPLRDRQPERGHFQGNHPVQRAIHPPMACFNPWRCPATSYSHWWRGVDQHSAGNNQQPDQLDVKDMQYVLLWEANASHTRYWLIFPITDMLMPCGRSRHIYKELQADLQGRMIQSWPGSSQICEKGTWRLPSSQIVRVCVKPSWGLRQHENHLSQIKGPKFQHTIVTII